MQAPRGITVIDGDTLEVDGQIVQLYGIDAPELGQSCSHDGTWQHCGLTAAFELEKLIGMQDAPALTCAPAPGASDRSIQVCQTGHTDVADVLLRAGYAIALSDASPEYLKAEDSARQGRLGLWHTDYTKPADWRAGKRLPGEAAAGIDPCPIKGIAGGVAGGGRGFYYVPTDRAYESIAIDPAKGDLLFCSDEQARAAGWRREGEAAAANVNAGG